jgi:regulation of enolase protein 1 (concanavalin A-like superfamily)
MLSGVVISSFDRGFSMWLARIDRILLPVVLLLICGQFASAAERDRRIKGWGRVVDPDGDCKIEAEKNVSLTVPAGLHDLSFVGHSGGQTAPRILQEVDGDFIAQVKVTGDFELGDATAVEGKANFYGAGLLLWVNENHFIRLERNVMRSGGADSCYSPLLEQWKNKKFVGKPLPVSDVAFFKGKSTYLRLERIGKDVYASMSHDGTEWIACDPLEVRLPQKVSIGVSATNTSNKDLKVKFEDYKLFVREGDQAKPVE